MAISTTVLRERLYPTILAVILVLCCSAGAYARVLEIRGFALTVSDMDRSVEFFEHALDFQKVSERTISDRNYDYLTGVFATRVRNVQLKLGDETIELEQYLSPAGQPIPIDSRSNDLWFQHFAVVVSDMDKAFEHIRTFPITGISSSPQTIPESNKGAAGIRAYKFRDPDGHPLELLYFPADKGNPKWQQANGKLFLGIDHSAITVSSTERSTDFYENFIGLRVKGGGVNTGTTPEQLDNAIGAVVRITGLRPDRSAGPGIEFLQYLAPSGGRTAPGGLRPNDLVLTRCIVEVDDLRSLITRLQNNNVTFISPDIIAVAGAPYSQALMVKDPDGHALLLVQK